MTLMAVDASPVLATLSTVAKHDEGAARELLRLALYESLCDQIDEARPTLEADLASFVVAKDARLRQELVRQFVDARLAKKDVSQILKISKAIGQDDPKTHFWDARDMLGRFTRAAASGNTMAQAVHGSRQEDDLDSPFDKPRYSGMRATGAALNTLNHSDAKLLGGALSAAGALGPEAEKVLGQGLRRTAYRYRGTEKRPSKTLKDDIKNGTAIIDGGSKALGILEAQDDADTMARQTRGKPYDTDRSTLRAKENVNPSVQIARYYAARGGGLSHDQKQLRVAGDIASAYYLDKLPSQESTAISIAAGQVPPSQGVIIDADGDVISEAMGFNGDHYVPFDLKNLRSLNGGQYVRTRATGGPTTEDIYTGLLSGARQVQVVSHSGVFTMEFDPSLRGGRRYSDKARQMVGRYQRILDAVNNGEKAGLYQHDLTPAETRKIRQDAASQFRDPSDAKAYGDRMITEARSAKSFKMLTDEEIDAEARTRLKAEPSANRARLQELRNEVREEARSDSVKAFQLDGDGYEAALKALQTEFPYFVRSVKRERLPDFVNSRGFDANVRFSSATDRGYVSPRNAASGMADSVTETKRGVRVRRGPFTAAERPGQHPDAPKPSAGGFETSQDTAGAPAAAQGASAPTGVLDHPTVKRKVNAAGEALKGAAPFWVVDPDAFAPPRADEDFLDLTDDRVLLSVTRQYASSGKTFSDYLRDQGPLEREAFVRALPFADAILDESNMPDRVKEQTSDLLSNLQTAMDLVTPFPVGNVLTYDPSSHGGRPVQVKFVEGLGTDVEAFDKLRNNLIANRDHEVNQRVGPVGDYLQQFEEADPESSDGPLSTIGMWQEKYEQASDDDDKMVARNHLAAAQVAYSFMRKRDLAQAYHDLTGGTPGKAPAPRTEGASLEKRLTWHRPGSAVASEFQKFLASR